MQKLEGCGWIYGFHVSKSDRKTKDEIKQNSLRNFYKNDHLWPVACKDKSAVQNGTKSLSGKYEFY